MKGQSYRGSVGIRIFQQEIVAAPDPEEPKVINLMEALKASVEGAKKARARFATKKS